MKAYNGSCRCYPLISAVVVGVIACGVPLEAWSEEVGTRNGTTQARAGERIASATTNAAAREVSTPAGGRAHGTLPSGLTGKPRVKTTRPWIDSERLPAPQRAVGGDTCATATTVAGLPYADTWSTCASSDDYDEICPLDAAGSPDVVYVYTPTSDITVDISLCADSAYDTKLYVYENACGAYQSGTFVSCNDDACATPSYPDPYVSKLYAVSLLAGNTYYIVVDGYGGECGLYTIDIVEGTSRETCPPESLHGQMPNQPDELWGFRTSDAATPWLAYESYAGLRSNVSGVTWWGFDARFDGVAGAWVECDEDPMTFNIAFYEDAGGSPGTEVCAYSMASTRGDTGREFLDSFGTPFQSWKYAATLDPTCFITDGWVSIQGTGGDPDCLFGWLSSPVGDGTSLQFDGAGLNVVDHDLSVCLSGQVVPPGEDCYEVGCALTYFSFGANPIPAGFLAPGSELFGGVVFFRGAGADRDIRIERFDAMDFGNPDEPTQTTPIELASMDLVSCEPIVVPTSGGPKEWNVQVELSTGTADAGILTATKTHENGGVFTMEYVAQLKFTFSRVDAPADIRIFDTAQRGLPPVPFGTVGEAPFVFAATIDVSPCGENFVPGVAGGDIARPACPQTCHVTQTCGPGGCTGNGGNKCSGCPRGACYSRNPSTDGECVVVEPTGSQSARWVCENCADPGADHCGVYIEDYGDCGDNENGGEGDGIPDVFEKPFDAASTTCLAADPWRTATNPMVADTDGDGCGDGAERDAGTDPCNPCQPTGGCSGSPGFTDNNDNGIPDACDLIAGLDCDGNGMIDAPSAGTVACDDTFGLPAGAGRADCKGACCHALTACVESTREWCETRVPDVRGSWSFIGLCTECPSTGGQTSDHQGMIIRHFPEGGAPLDVCLAAPLRERVACTEGDFIDAWQTDPTQEMCHQFGVDDANCPAECPVDCSPPIPAGFFGVGSDLFAGEVCLEGVSIGGIFGEADTLIRRSAEPFGPCDLPSALEVTVDAELIELSLKSKTPIWVAFNGETDCKANPQNCELWDVVVALSDTVTPPVGEVSAIKTHCNGGTYSSVLNVQPKFTFTKVGGGGTVVLDTGTEGICYVTLIQGQGAEPDYWLSDLDPGVQPLSPYCTDFHPAYTTNEPECSEGTDPPNCDCDCNVDGVRDKCNIESGTSQDCNGNGIPDECELSGNDCNGNGIPDDCEEDCNRNGEPDDCDVNPTDPDGNGLVSPDCNNNGVPDECENDCNGNGVVDQCDVPASAGYPGGFCTADCSEDCNENGMPDECEPDCNGNGLPDSCDMTRPVEPSLDCQLNGRPDECDLASGLSVDCNGNGVPDECDIADESSSDCNANGVPDECEANCDADSIPNDCEIANCPADDPSCQDCNGNGVPDGCDIADMTSGDCQPNGIPDECEIDDETSLDCQPNDIPDECDIASGSEQDCNGDGVPDSCESDPSQAAQGGGVAKNRYIAFLPNNSSCVAFQITLPDGRVGWIGEPSSKDWMGEDPVDVALVVDTPVVRVWSASVVYVTGCVIAPDETYEIRTTDGDGFFTVPYIVGTVPAPGVGSWADIVGTFDGNTWTAPNGIVNFYDINAAVSKFQVSAGAAHVTVIDLHPQWPNYVVNFSDISMVIKGFQGDAYPVPATDCQAIANCPLGAEAACLP